MSSTTGRRRRKPRKPATAAKRSRQIYDARTGFKEKQTVLDALDLAAERFQELEHDPGIDRTTLIRRGLREQIRKAGLEVPTD
jgi:hypothetical protein